MEKLANPLYYPLAVLMGAIALVVGVRLVKLPSVIVVPTAVAIATAGAAVLKSRTPPGLELDDPQLEQEVLAVRQQAISLAERAKSLQLEAGRLLTEADQVELLGIVQYACDHAEALPAKIDHLAQRLQGSDSLLSVEEMRQQLREVEAKLRNSSGVAQEQLQRLADSLQRNIQLARQGRDARQAQVTSLATLILETAGVLQQLQNKLRTANLGDTAATSELRSLGDQLRSFQDNVDLLVSP